MIFRGTEQNIFSSVTEHNGDGVSPGSVDSGHHTGIDHVGVVSGQPDVDHEDELRLVMLLDCQGTVPSNRNNN